MRTLEREKKRFILIALVVPVVLLICFVVFPAIDLFRMSFTDWDGYSQGSNFIAMENYKSMFQNKDLWMSLKNNAVYFVVHLCMIPLELAFAVLLTSKLRAARFYKTMVFMPYIINGVAIAYAFSYFFSPINGAFDEILKVLHLGFLSQSWLSDSKVVNYVLSSVSVWRFSGYHIILSLLAPATATVVIIKSINIINDMYIPYLYMPNSQRTLTTFLMNYANAQQGSWKSLAAGIIIIMLPTVLIYVFFQKYILAGISAGAVKG